MGEGGARCRAAGRGVQAAESEESQGCRESRNQDSGKESHSQDKSCEGKARKDKTSGTQGQQTSP